MNVIMECYMHAILIIDQQKDLITPGNKEALHLNIKMALKKKNCELFAIGGTSNHIHFICSMNLEMSLDELMKKLKLSTQMEMQLDGNKDFFWEDGYYAYTISKGRIKEESEAIQRQPIFHRNICLKDELEQIRIEMSLEESDDLTDINENSFN